MQRTTRTYLIGLMIGIWSATAMVAQAVEISGITYLKNGSNQYVMEAEIYNNKTAGPSQNYPTPSDPSYIREWIHTTGTHANARGSAYMKAIPDLYLSGAGGTPTNGGIYNDTASVGNGPQLNYSIYVPTAGTYQLYVRSEDGTASNNGYGDSLYAQLFDPTSAVVSNGTLDAGKSYYHFGHSSYDKDFNTNPWLGTARRSSPAGGALDPSTWTITTPGVYNLRVTYREEGVALDALIFQQSSVTAPTLDGPLVSQYFSPTNYTLAATTGASAIIVNGSTTVTSTANNAGAGTADALSVTGLGSSANIGSVSGSTTSGGPVALSTSTANSGQSFTSSTAGLATIMPGIATAVNANITGNASAGGATTTQVSVFDHANASFSDSSDLDTLDLDLGDFLANSGDQTGDFSIFNLEALAGYTADLDLDDVVDEGGSNALTTNLLAFFGLAANGDNDFEATFDTTGLAPGTYTRSFTLNLSDEDLSGDESQSLTLNLSATVVPEPSSLAMLAFGAAMFWLVRKKG